jgi:hypothetical protein
MKLIVTPHELMDEFGVWKEYCELTGTNEWAVNEGLMDSETPLTLTEDEAEQLDLRVIVISEWYRRVS